jgi:hypothetical protein
MTDIYGALPTFSQGQVLSASGHLNTLQDYVQALRDDFSGLAMPFSADHTTREAYYAIRHKYDTLVYRYEIITGHDACLQIYFDGSWYTIPGSEHTGAGEYSGLIDLSGQFDLTYDAFYEYRFTIAYDNAAGGRLRALLLAEAQGAQLVTNLPDFVDGMVPTAQQWQALSDRASEIAVNIYAPQPTGQRTWDGHDIMGVEEGRFVNGLFNHRSRHLAYCFEAKRSDNRDEDGYHYTDCQIKINGDSVLRRRTGGSNAPGEAEPGEDYVFVEGGGYKWTGTLDLDAYPGTLVVGEDYTWEFHASAKGGGTGGGEGLGGSNANCGLHYLFEIPEETDMVLPLGWIPFVTWSHGMYVSGNTYVNEMPAAQWIVANLNLLNGAVLQRNLATVLDRAVDGYGLYGVRRWRWLHYRTDPDPELCKVDNPNHYVPLPDEDARKRTGTPTLSFDYKGKTEPVQTSLDDAYQEWRTVDLDSIDGLVPGTPYKISHVRYALEDVNA